MSGKETDASNSSGSGPAMKVGIVLVLAVAVGAAVYAKRQPAKDDTIQVTAGTTLKALSDPASQTAVSERPEAASALPRLVDLGADKCIPCKAMAPILEELKRDYAGVFAVEFIDVWKRPEAAEPFNIQLIPTQIFLDSNGKELFRHQGFFSKEEILAKWKELGIDISRKAD